MIRTMLFIIRRLRRSGFRYMYKIEEDWLASRWIAVRLNRFDPLFTFELHTKYKHSWFFCNVFRFDSYCHSVEIITYKNLAGHTRTVLSVIFGRQQYVYLLFGRWGKFIEMGLDINFAGCTCKLFIAESKNVDILIDSAVGHIHEIITWMSVLLPALHSIAV